MLTQIASSPPVNYLWSFACAHVPTFVRHHESRLGAVGAAVHTIELQAVLLQEQLRCCSRASPGLCVNGQRRLWTRVENNACLQQAAG